MANPFHHTTAFVPYPFRPFWQPNSHAVPSVLPHEVELTQKLDAAEKKIDEYSRLIASLFAELRRYQDTICRTCKENVLHATLIAGSTPISTESTSRPVPTVAAIFPDATSSRVQKTDELSHRSAPSFGAQDQQSELSPQAPGPHVPEASSVAISSPDNSQVAPVHSSTTITPDVLASPASSSADSSPSTPEIKTNIATTQPNPDWTVEYNPEIKQNLSLHLADTFTLADKVFCTKFSHDGNILAVGLRIGEVHVYDMMTKSKRILAERPPRVFYSEVAELTLSEIWTIRFSLDNKYLATGGSDGQINIWEIDRRRRRASFRHSDLVRCVDLSPNRHFVVSASYDNSVCMWNMRDGSRRMLYQHETLNFMSAAFSPDGRYVAAGNDDGFVRIWNARSNQLVAKYQIDGATFLRSVVFTLDGQGIAIGGATVQCRDFCPVNEIQSGRYITEANASLIYEFQRHTNSITTLSFSPDNRWIVSGSRDRCACILDARNGTWMCTLKAHTYDIWGVDFCPSGHYIVTGSQDSRVRLWKYEVVE